MIGPSLVRGVLTTGVLLGDLAIARCGGLARAGLAGDRPNGRAICVFGIKPTPVRGCDVRSAGNKYLVSFTPTI